jgi:hypothetical protein
MKTIWEDSSRSSVESANSIGYSFCSKGVHRKTKGRGMDVPHSTEMRIFHHGDDGDSNPNVNDKPYNPKCSNRNGHIPAIMINTTNTFYGYSLVVIAFPIILSSLLPLMSLD